MNSTTSDPQPGSPNEQIAVDSTWTVSGLAMGTDYHFLYKVIVVGSVEQFGRDDTFYTSLTITIDF